MNKCIQKFKVAIAVGLFVVLAMTFSLLFAPPSIEMANASTIGMEAKIINIAQLDDYIAAPNDIAIVKIATYDQYASIMRDYVGSIDSSSEYPYAIAFLPLPSGMTVVHLEASSDALLVSAAEAKYLQDINLDWGTLQSKVIANFTNSMFSQAGTQSLIYIAHGFSFDANIWKTYGIWSETTTIMRGKVSLFGSTKDIYQVTTKTLNMYVDALNGEFFAQLTVFCLVPLDSHITGVSASYQNIRAYNSTIPSEYIEYAPHSTQGSTTTGQTTTIGGSSGTTGSINFGYSESMSYSSSDVVVLDTSNLFGVNDTVTLGYTFSGNYAKGTMWLDSYVIAQVNNSLGNVGMQRVLSVVVNSKNTLWNQNYSQTVLNQTNILFPISL